MRLLCIFREGEDYSRSVNEWLENFRRQTGRELEVMDPDKETAFCETYDVVEFPTFLALGNDGSVRAAWSGRDLPLINDVLYYALQ